MLKQANKIFHFTRREQTAVLVLLGILLVTIGIRVYRQVYGVAGRIDTYDYFKGVVKPVRAQGPVEESKEGLGHPPVSPLQGGGAVQAWAEKSEQRPMANSSHDAARPNPSAQLRDQDRATRVNDVSVININTASAQELEKLPRVGPKLAQRIIAYREANGGFGAPEHICRVKGIGKKTFEKMKGMIAAE